MVHQFVLCMWSEKRRKKLLKQAAKYEALLVLGCEAAFQTVRYAVKSYSGHIHQGLVTKGLMSIRPRISLTGKVSLDLESLTLLSL